MTDVWIAPGHGRRPDGTLDPGASAGSKTEQSEGDLIVGHAIARLREYGLTVYRQPRGGPNFTGSIVHINSLRPTVAVEVHHDWSGAPRGGFGHWHSSSAKAKVLAHSIFAAIGRAGLPTRPSWLKARDELAIVRQTVVPTVLWECDRIGAVTDHRVYGRALADGIAAYLGTTTTTPPPEDPMSWSSWAEAARAWAQDRGIITASTRPKDPATNEQVVVMIHRALGGSAVVDRQAVAHARALLAAMEAEGSNPGYVRQVIQHVRAHPGGTGGGISSDQARTIATGVAREELGRAQITPG